MENKSFLNKILFVIIILVLLIVLIFFITNNKKVNADLKEVEVITSMNVDTYDVDLYIYKLENDKLYTSEYFYNNYFLSNNSVTFDEFNITENTKFYLKTLSNTINDLENIKITYDPITKDEFNFLLNNYTLLKTYIWLNKDNTVKNVLLYSSNNIELVME